MKPMLYLCILPFFVFGLLQLSTIGIAGLKVQATSDAPANPRELVREVVENGLRQRNRDLPRWSFREVIRKDGRLETHEVCQTATGTIDRLIAVNDQPLSAEQQRHENARLQSVLADGAEIRKERQKQREDAAKQFRMFATFPDAFRYEYAGREGGLVKLRFEPNPQFVPDSRQEEVFHHLEGMMWIDSEQKQLARIDGRLTSEVKFVGGLLGHLDEGGVFSVRFRELDSGQWVMADLHVDMSGKALFFKTISVQEQREFDDYRRVPDDFTLQQAAEFLREQASSPRQSAANSPK